MKKLFTVMLSIFMLCGCVVKKNQEIIKINETEFDKMKITFYQEVIEYSVKDAAMSTSSVYYCTENSSLKYPNAAPYLISKDNTIKFYVDLFGNNEIYDENNNIIHYVEEIKYDDKAIHIYHLNNNEKYYEKAKGSNDYSIFGCISSATGKSGVCSKEYHFSYEDLMTEIDTWQEVGSYYDYADYKDFKLFMNIDFNKNEIGGFQKAISFYNAELDNGNWLVKLEEGSSKYYLLNTTQVDELKELMK